MTSFSVNFDYRCPFARIAHLHVLDGLAAGANWNVRFVPFSLGQAQAEEAGSGDVWDAPETDTGLLALQVSVVVRDRFPEVFPDLHRRLFELRHTEFKNLADRDELEAALSAAGLDPVSVFADIATGEPLKTVRAEHEASVAENSVWGVPTFMANGQAAFVRLMEEPKADGMAPINAVERIVDTLADWPQLNEFKHTTLNR